MKHSSNITRIVLTCCSIVVSAALSVLLFNLKLNAYFLASFILVCVSLVIYNLDGAPKPIADNGQEEGKSSLA